MINKILLEVPAPYDTGILTLQLNRQIEINISAEEARRKVNNFIHLEVSTQMHAETPLLMIGETVLWRVPVHLTFPSFGNVGCVGFMYIDPITGDLNNLSLTTAEIVHNAENLAARFAFSPAH